LLQACECDLFLRLDSEQPEERETRRARCHGLLEQRRLADPGLAAKDGALRSWHDARPPAEPRSVRFLHLDRSAPPQTLGRRGRDYKLARSRVSPKRADSRAVRHFLDQQTKGDRGHASAAPRIHRRSRHRPCRPPRQALPGKPVTQDAEPPLRRRTTRAWRVGQGHDLRRKPAGRVVRPDRQPPSRASPIVCGSGASAFDVYDTATDVRPPRPPRLRRPTANLVRRVLRDDYTFGRVQPTR